MAEVRNIRVELTSRQVAYRGSFKRAVIDFAPNSEEAFWGAAPTEQKARDVFRALVDPSAADSRDDSTMDEAFRPRIISCEPDPESLDDRFERNGQASRWIIESNTPYCD